MNRKIYFLLIFFISIIFIACDVFPTRIPEDPSNPANNYIPPTTQNMLIENFQSSINSADYNNYINCFSSKSNGQIKEFEFVPSGDVFNLYTSLFLNWHFTEETRNFKSIVSNISSDSKPNLNFSKKEFSEISTDSTVFTADYELNINLKEDSKLTLYSGKILLNIYREPNGLWYISKWNDVQSSNAGNFKTWSNLKVSNSN